MNKKINKNLVLVIVLVSSLPYSLVSAETVEEVPTGETTISSMADDPLKEYTQMAANQSSSIKEQEENPGHELQTTKDTLSNESNVGNIFENQVRTKPQTRGGGIGPQSGNTLVEGLPSDSFQYDIDKKFADVIRSIYPSAPNPMIDDFMESLISLEVGGKGLTSLKGIEYALNLTSLGCSYNQLSELDISKNVQLSSLNLMRNQISELDVSKNTVLTSLNFETNKISVLDVSKNQELLHLSCFNNLLSEIDVSENSKLITFYCGKNLLNELDVSKNVNLVSISCGENLLGELDISNNTNLQYLYCGENQLDELDINNNKKLTLLNCEKNQISELNVSQNSNLTELRCGYNPLGSLDVSYNTNLMYLYCEGNGLYELDVSENTQLITLYCMYNHIVNITKLANLVNLTNFSADGQIISVPVPVVSVDGKATIDILKTSAHAGLSASNQNVTPTPNFNYDEDKLLLSNVTRDSLSEKTINFTYNSSQLIEGAPSGVKKFGGTITFFTVSELGNNLKPTDEHKAYTGEEVEWAWTIASLTTKKAENIKATLSLPVTGVVIVPNSVSVTRNGVLVGNINDLESGTDLGELNHGEYITISFKTKVSGAVEEWLELMGNLDWKDDTFTSPYNNESKGRVQIQDDEQTYTPKDSDDMALQSVPIYFNHGTNPIVNTAQTHHLHSMNYQSNTNVVTDGFYTRIKDDRSVSTGWKLTAKLSDFKDSSNSLMPNGTGTSLKLGNMSIERVTDRDTPQETIDPSPTGADVPSSVQTTETLVAGQQTAKTLVSAQPNEGQDTWQLRMPFDKISLNLPANAGKKGTVYKANLTWSLDDTP